MKNALEKLIDSAKENNRHIILPEANDSRILQAASFLTQQNIATITLIGSKSEIDKVAHENQIELDGVNCVEQTDSKLRDQFSRVLFRARQHKGISLNDALDMILDPLVMGACMVRSGYADGMVAGATHPTSDVVRCALQYIGMKPGSKIVSSFFIMEHELPHQEFQGTAIYADCGMVIDPDAEDLASIAIDSADSAKALVGIEPKVALLSFSTAGSAQHALVDKVREAGHLVSEARPDIALMTEVQFDAAITPEILSKKAPEITVTAPANVFIFPDLQSGNIAYKIAQRIGGVKAIGPVLQGLNQPINDLSRGCSVDDIVNLVAVTAVQANKAEKNANRI